MYQEPEPGQVEVAVRKTNSAETVAVEVAVRRKIPAGVVAFAAELAVVAVRRKIPLAEQQSQANNWNMGPVPAGVAGRRGWEGRAQVPGRQS